MKHAKPFLSIISILSFIVIFFWGAAQSLPAAAQVSQTTADGLHIIIFKTSYGEIVVYLPEDLVGGESISGAVTALPSGKNQDKQEKNLAHLNDFSLAIGEQSADIQSGWGKWTLPQKDLLPVTLSDAKGKVDARVEVPIFEESNIFKTEGFHCPPYALAGKSVQFYGKFDGDFSNTLIWIGDEKTSLRAETPRRIIFESPVQPLGFITFKYMEGETGGKCQYQNIRIESSIAEPKIKKGQTTELYVAVTGLEGLRKKIPITIENSTPELAEVAGSDTIFIQPGDVQVGGLFAYKTTITGIKPGHIKIQARLLPYTPGPAAGDNLNPPRD